MSEDRKESIEEAEKEGYSVIHSSSNLLLLDLDGPEDEAHLQDIISVLKQRLKVVVLTTWTSKTEGHKHVVLQVNRNMEPRDRVALQAILGSDRKRELLSLFRVWDAEPDFSMLFRPKPKKGGE